MPLNPGTIIEGYEIIETIGTGAMSTVYLAKKDGNNYAIKELKSEFSSPEEEKIIINLDPRDRYIDTGLFRDELVEYYEEHFGSFTSHYGKNLACIKERSPSTLTSFSQLFSQISIY